MANGSRDKQEILDEVKQTISTERINPLERRIDALEEKLEYQKFSTQVVGIFKDQFGTEFTRNKLACFNEFFKTRNFYK